MNPFDPDRFLVAQEGSYDDALAELRRGRKQSHWMWFVFPQIAGLGRSAMAARYAIDSLEDARAYLTHPVLGPRLVEATRAATAAAGTAEQILGGIDAIKLRSSMTLFAEAATDAAKQPFEAALTRFFAGKRDPETMRRL